MRHRNQTIGLILVAAATVLSVASGGSGADEYGGVYDGSCEDDYPRAAASGALETGVTALSYDEQDATVRLGHKRDVDRFEDGCVAKASLSFSIEGNCQLQLQFEAVPAVEELVLVYATLDADSACPGWRDELEGVYRYAGVGDARLAIPTQMPEDTAEACVELDLAPRGTVTLSAEDREDIEITLDGLMTSGPSVSEGDPDLSCPGA